MASRTDTDNFLTLFLNDIPLLDVRAPVEFHKGAFPTSENVPLLDDSEREVVGIKYKEEGQDEAIALGLKLSTPEMREQRLRDWKAFVGRHPDGYLYCFRGGLRSRTSQAWLREQGIDYPLVKGGYKAMRGFLLEQLEQNAQQVPFVILSGMTGSGKTHVIQKIRHHIDLEGLANHRGSAFGRDVNDYQPSQIDFENALSIALLQHHHRHPGCSLMLEDEGRLIGRLYLPPEFYQRMIDSPRVFLERDIEDRVRITSDDYFGHAWPLYQATHGDQARDRFCAFALENLARIQKRLGGERYHKIHHSFDDALERLFEQGDGRGFDEGVQILLEEYYDPMYRYQLQKKPRDTIFSGDEQAILEWAQQNMGVSERENTVSGTAR
jgi:tRNA 2-selenouridine synthase